MNDAVSNPDTEVAPQLPGRQLAAARENCAFSIADVARELRLSPQQVEAMEADDYERLPGPVFVRGYIRNYAHLLKLDPQPLLDGAEQQLAPATRVMPVMPPSADTPMPTGREFHWHKYAIVLLILLVPLVIFEFYRDDAIDTFVSSREVPPQQPQAVAPPQRVEESAAPPAVALGDGATAPARPESLTAQSEKTRLENKSTIPPGAAATERMPGGRLIRLRFEQESWVEIHDRNGRTIFSRLNSAGTEQTVSGEPPFRLVVGNASGVRLSYNDQPVNLAPFTKVDVARLILE